jgi:hypothetical protein
MENSDKAFTSWLILMCAMHATAIISLAMVEHFEKKPKAKQKPARVSIQLVRAVPSPLPKPILPASIEPISLQSVLKTLDPPSPPSSIKNFSENPNKSKPLVPRVPQVKVPIVTSPDVKKPGMETKFSSPKITSFSTTQELLNAAIPEVKVKRPSKISELPVLREPKLSVPKLQLPETQTATPKLPVINQNAPTELPTNMAPKPINSLPRTELATVPAPELQRLETQQSIGDLNAKLPPLGKNPANDNTPQILTNRRLEQNLRDSSNIPIPRNDFAGNTAPSIEYQAKPEETEIPVLLDSLAKLERDQKSILPDTVSQDFALPKPKPSQKQAVSTIPPEPKNSKINLPTPQENPFPLTIKAGIPNNGPKITELNPKKQRKPFPPAPALPNENFDGVQNSTSVLDQNSIFDSNNLPPTLTQDANINNQVQNTLLLSQQNEKVKSLQKVEKIYSALVSEVLNKNLQYRREKYKGKSLLLSIVIELDGSVSEYRILEASGAGEKDFDKEVMAGMEVLIGFTAFPILPEEIAENPPYIVRVRIKP